MEAAQRSFQLALDAEVQSHDARKQFRNRSPPGRCLSQESCEKSTTLRLPQMLGHTHGFEPPTAQLSQLSESRSDHINFSLGCLVSQDSQHLGATESETSSRTIPNEEALRQELKQYERERRAKEDAQLTSCTYFQAYDIGELQGLKGTKKRKHKKGDIGRSGDVCSMPSFESPCEDLIVNDVPLQLATLGPGSTSSTRSSASSIHCSTSRAPSHKHSSSTPSLDVIPQHSVPTHLSSRPSSESSAGACLGNVSAPTNGCNAKHGPQPPSATLPSSAPFPRGISSPQGGRSQQRVPRVDSRCDVRSTVHRGECGSTTLTPPSAGDTSISPFSVEYVAYHPIRLIRSARVRDTSHSDEMQSVTRPSPPAHPEHLYSLGSSGLDDIVLSQRNRVM